MADEFDSVGNMRAARFLDFIRISALYNIDISNYYDIIKYKIYFIICEM